MQSDQTNADATEKLVELLSDANKTKRVFWLRFADDEEHNLTDFAVCQDIGEEYPHCAAIVVRPMRAPEHKLKSFPLMQRCYFP